MQPRSVTSPGNMPLKPIRATYCGFQPGFRHLPGVELYNLQEDLCPAHPKGSTVSLQTIRKYGRYVPPVIL
jgi:hypothetical protein